MTSLMDMKPSDVTPHDRLHHLLFGHREVIEDLLRHVIRHLDFANGGSWLDGLDWSTLKREPEISTSRQLDRRIRDVVWSVSWRGSPLFLILLIEFQSQPHRFMALRQLTYLSLFYEDLVKSGRIGKAGLLPPALPICLYNGEESWRAPVSLEELVAPYPRELGCFQPRFQYLLIDELKTQVDISGDRNTAGSVFAIQQIENRHQLLAVLEAVDRWLPRSAESVLRQDILGMVRQVMPDQLLEIDQGLSLEEFAMGAKERLTKDLENFGQALSDKARSLGRMEGRTEGRAEGRAEGRTEGRTEGQRVLLAKQLRLKFGPLPAAVEERLAAADVHQLETWAARILTASRLDQIWAS